MGTLANQRAWALSVEFQPSIALRECRPGVWASIHKFPASYVKSDFLTVSKLVFFFFFKCMAEVLGLGIEDLSISGSLWAAKEMGLPERPGNFQDPRCCPVPSDPLKESWAGGTIMQR